MIYNKYGFGGKVTGAFAALLMLAACGDKSDDQAATETENADMVADADTADVGERVGTWGDIVYGDPNAPITVVEYASLTCPHCATFAKDYMPEFKKKFVDTGKVQLHFRNYVMNRVDLAASAAARCSNAEVTKKLMEVYFARQSDWARSENPIDELASLARRSGISRTQFDRCMADKDMHRHLMALTMTGQKEYGVNSTPSFFVEGERVEFSTFEELMAKLEEAIGDAS